MKTMTQLLMVVIASLALAGCFQVDQVVTVAPDGSGTVEETFLISRKIGESMAALTGGGDEEQAGKAKTKKKKKAAAKTPSFFKDEEIRSRAQKMGEGVRFVRMKRITNKQFEGYQAVFAFKDINQLRLDQSGGAPMAPGAASGEPAKSGTQFVFTPGPTATLVVKPAKKPAPADEGKEPPTPADAKDAKPAEPAEQPAAAADPGGKELEMLRQMFGGMRIAMTVVIKGSIVETNATHRSGSRITLADVDFGKMLDKPELLAKMAEIPPGDTEAAMAMFKKVPGMKVDMNDELRISFR